MFDGAIIFLRGGMNMSSQVYDVQLSICQQEPQTMTFYIDRQNNKLQFVIQLRFLFFSSC